MTDVDDQPKPKRRPGFPRAGPGRPKGLKNKDTIIQETLAAQGIKAAIATGVLPLEIMLHRMRGTQVVTDEQFAAAVAAAPYMHARLAAIAIKDTTPRDDMIDLRGASPADLAIIRKYVADVRTIDGPIVDGEAQETDDA